jgi:hypothetical protein
MRGALSRAWRHEMSMGIAGVRLSWYPWGDNGFPSLPAHGLIANHGLLDAFAREYANDPHLNNTGETCQLGAEMQDFFLVWLQGRLSNIVAGIDSAPDPYELDVFTAEGLGTAPWLVHLIGYCASVWLCAQWIEFDGTPNSHASRSFRARCGGASSTATFLARPIGVMTRST